MRRPTLCGDVHTVDDTYLNAAQGTTPVDKEGRLSRVKRMLADSLLLGRRATSSSCSRNFGVPLDEIALTKEGVPVVISKICSYLENNGLHCEGLFQFSAANPKLAERLRNSLDLDGANDVFTTALLLKIWLKELPEPIVWGHVASELLSTHGKVSEESVGTWRQAIRIVLCSLPETNLRLLRYILRFLHRYNHHQQQRSSRSNAYPMLNHLGSVFAPLLILRDLEYYGAEQLSQANILTSRLIQDHASIFHQWLLDHPNEVAPKSINTSPSDSHNKLNHEETTVKPMEDAENNSSCGKHRKRKERNESANSNQSLERKVIRSSSEERHLELSVGESKNENIRRVSSHEDFRHAKHKVKSPAVNKFTTVVELSDQPQIRFSGLPLQECNHRETSVQSKDYVQYSLHGSCLQQKENEVQKDNQQMLKFRDHPFSEVLDDEHEKRRSSERVSRSLVPPRSVARRNIGRKKRAHQTSSSSVVSEGEDSIETCIKERDDISQSLTSDHMGQNSMRQHHSRMSSQHSLSSEERDDDAEPEVEVESLSDESRPGSSHSFLQLHPPERERSPSPSVSPCTPPLDLTTLHQSVDGSEPVASRVGWDFVRPQNQDECGRGLLLSPRNSMILTRRVYMDHNVPPSPPGDHHGSCLPGPALDLENLLKKLNKQITSIKKKLKRYEEGFEREFGYRPSQSDKMANKDIKKMCSDLSRLRRELKQIKENPLSAMASQAEKHLGLSGLSECNIQVMSGRGLSFGSFEETIVEVERRLKERRRFAGRPESVDDMTPEQHSAEKLAMQKALLMLEKVCGRATSKQDREIVRPLYDRYRMLKRTVARAASSKLKDSINELATIHEHEAMDFTPLTSVLAMADSGVDAQSQSQGSTGSVIISCSSHEAAAGGGVAALQTQPSVEETSDSQTSSSDSLGENLHALPLSDLVLQLTQTREEKKKLRRLLREQEEVFQQQTGRRMLREDRATVAGDILSKDYSVMYSSYKQVKAKLRLLEALVAKQR